jgi:hypothetical protein
MASVLDAVEAGFKSPDLTAPLVEASELLASRMRDTLYAPTAGAYPDSSGGSFPLAGVRRGAVRGG